MHVVFIEPRFPGNQKQFVRGARRDRRDRHRDRRGQQGLARRRAQALADPLRGGRPTSRRGRRCSARCASSSPRRTSIGSRRRSRRTSCRSRRSARRPASPARRVRTAFLCRDKPAMKEVAARRRRAVRAVDRRVDRRRGPRVRRARRLPADPQAARRRRRVGRGARRHRRPSSTPRSRAFGGARSIAIEEFIEGHEGFYDTLDDRRRGRPRLRRRHYYPNVLEAMRTRWISPQFIATNRIDDAPAYDEVKALGAEGRRAARHRDLGDPHGVVLRAQGPQVLARSAAARPACARGISTTSRNDMDLYREWAMAICAGPAERSARRGGSSAGIIALRPDRDGQIAGYDGPRRDRQGVRRQHHRRATCRPRARRPSRSRPATWRTRGCA